MTIEGNASVVRSITFGATGSLEVPSMPPPEPLIQCYTELIDYFEKGRHTFETPLDPAGTPFQLKIWNLLRDIPFGETITYAELARRAGNPLLTRAVGAANGRNPIPIIIPCHRVIGSNGQLVGFAGGLQAKHWLLQHEQDHRAPRLF